MKSIRILTVDDHFLVRDGLKIMLESQTMKHRFIVDEAENAEQGIKKALKKNYDLIIMDYEMPGMNGAEAVKKIMQKKPLSNILALSTYDENAHITSMLKAGAKGYVLKNIGPDELIKAIETILSGKKYYSNDVAIKLIKVEEDSQKYKMKKKKIFGKKLSLREKDVLRLIGNEYTNEEIAKELLVGKRTVEYYRENLLVKLKVKNTAGLIKKAMEIGIIQQ